MEPQEVIKFTTLKALMEQVEKDGDVLFTDENNIVYKLEKLGTMEEFERLINDTAS